MTYYIMDNIEVELIDIIAFSLFVISWITYSYLSQHFSSHRNNLFTMVNQHRLRWMKQMLRRENRISDITAVTNLLRSISFFANTSIFIVLGVTTLFGYTKELTDVIAALPFGYENSDFLMEVKLFLLIFIFVYAFFKFTWSLRQYNYTSIFISAAPMPYDRDICHDAYAESGAALMASSGKHFNLGMRAYYYGLAAFTWFLHPVLFITTTIVVILVLYRREFHSNAYASLAIYEQCKEKKHAN